MSTTFFRGENPLKADKLNTAFAERVSRGGDTMQGMLRLAADPVAAFDAATKQYVDRFTSMGVPTGAYIGAAPPGNTLAPLWWDTNSGQLFIQYNDGSSTQWVSANSVDAAQLEGSFLPLTGGVVSGKLTVQPPTMATNGFDAGQYIITRALGSGVNGPWTAQIGLRIEHEKENWGTTTQVGELDGLYIHVRQGGPNSDVGGILVDVQSRGQGFTAAHEYHSSTIDDQYFLSGDIDSQVAYWNGSDNSGGGHVLTVGASRGQNLIGLTIQSGSEPRGTFTGSISGTTMTVSALTSGVVGPATVIAGSGVAANTIVSAQLTGGIGGTGTYSVTPSQTVASTAMTSTPQAWWTDFARFSQGGVLKFHMDGESNTNMSGRLVLNTVNNAKDGGILLVQGGDTTTNTADAGAYLMWNRDGSGQTWLLNNKGGGPGGITLGAVDDAHVVTPWMVLDSTGVWTAPIPFHFGAAFIYPPSNLVNAVNDAAAGAASVPVGAMYRNGSQLMVRIV